MIIKSKQRRPLIELHRVVREPALRPNHVLNEPRNYTTGPRHIHHTLFRTSIISNTWSAPEDAAMPAQDDELIPELARLTGISIEPGLNYKGKSNNSWI